jgi:NitT/TauT family transport system permease protein
MSRLDAAPSSAPADPDTTTRPGPGGSAPGGVLLAVLSFVIAIALWQAGAWALALRTPVAEAFGPLPAAQAGWALLTGGEFARHAAVSLQRLGAGLLLGLLVGVPLGLLTGLSRSFAQASTPLFQFLRMVSPLSWMPLAVIVLGVGDAPVIFLLGFAALWPILLNTAAGVSALDPDWLALGRSLSATRREMVLRIVLPGITAHLLTGVRLAIGLLWIVIVPAEMLGVSAGLGYFVLDTRDRLAYPELMAAIVLIGALGWALDAAARRLHAHWAGSGSRAGQRPRTTVTALRERLAGSLSRAAAARRPAG